MLRMYRPKIPHKKSGINVTIANRILHKNGSSVNRSTTRTNQVIDSIFRLSATSRYKQYPKTEHYYQAQSLSGNKDKPRS